MLMRSALRMSLSAEPDIEVIGEAVNGEEAVALAQQLRPDVLVMDIRMPNVDGIAATQLLTAQGMTERVRVLVLTTFHFDEYVAEALGAGASGFLLKDATADELSYAVRVVAAGNALVSPAVTRRLLERYAHYLPTSRRDGGRIVSQLTERELTVLRLVARGLSNREIAAELHLAESSVKTHVSRLLQKLDVPDRVHLVVLAYEIGLVALRGGR